MGRKVISFAPSGLILMYYERIASDLSEKIKSYRTQHGKGLSDVGNTAILNRMIEEFFLLKYGQEERKKIRDLHYEKTYEEMSQLDLDI